MKRWLAVLLSVLLLTVSVPTISAAPPYNDDELNWGGFGCPHTNLIKEAAVSSTCISQGHDAYTMCADCYTVLEGSKELLPLGDHGYDNPCDSVCNHCGEQREVGEHSYVEEVVREATCTQTGICRIICVLCDDIKGEEILPALGHTEVTIPGQEPTCTESGLTEGVQCTTCGEILTAQESIPALGHAYDDDYDEECNRCGYIRDDAKPIPGDANGDGKVNNKDLGLMQFYLNEWEVTVNVQALDVNGDGRINNFDLGLLQRQLNQ